MDTTPLTVKGCKFDIYMALTDNYATPTETRGIILYSQPREPVSLIPVVERVKQWSFQNC